MVARLRKIFRTQQYAEYEVDLRTRFLGNILLGATVIATLYLAAGLTPVFSPRLYPWDGLLGLIVCGLVYVAYRASKVALAASWLVAAVNILATFEMQFYGVSHPATALFLIGIILAGILIGGWFLPLWTFFGGVFVLVWSFVELSGEAGLDVDFPIQSVPELISIVAFWWLLFIVVGWLVWLFAQRLETAVRLSRSQTTTLARTLQTLSTNPNLDAFLEEVVLTLTAQLKAKFATLIIHDVDDDLLRSHQAYLQGKFLGAEQVDGQAPPPTPAVESALWQELLATKAPIVVADPANDTRIHFREGIIAQGLQTILLIPLLAGDCVGGFFSINSLEKRVYREAELEVGQALAQQAMLAIQLSELAVRGQQTAVLEERNRLARDIHDTLAQGFTGIVIQLEAAEDLVEEASVAGASAKDISSEANEVLKPVLTHLGRARQLARESLAEARRSVKALRPQVLEERSLAEAFRHMVARLTPGTTVTARVDVAGDEYRLRSETEDELLRIGQEAVTNSLRHGKATAIHLTLEYRPQQMVLAIQDNGIGFNPAQPVVGFGITGMRERAMKIGARLDMQVQVEGGTRVVCVLNRK